MPNTTIPDISSQMDKYKYKNVSYIISIYDPVLTIFDEIEVQKIDKRILALAGRITKANKKLDIFITGSS